MTEIKKVNKDVLAENLENKFELSKAESRRIVDSIFEDIENALVNKQEVSIYGFGKFQARYRAERQGHNPSTGEKITIKASHVPKFEAFGSLKEKLKEI